MAEETQEQNVNIPDYLPYQGELHFTDEPVLILCKPKLMPLKSVTLEKLEKMQKEADEKLKEQQQEQLNIP